MKTAAPALLLFCAGCVVPQNVEQAPPAPSDQPPFVTATYPPQGTLVVSQNCPKVTFKILGISDCDLQDSVEVQWLTNYDPKNALPAENKTNYRSGPGGRSAGCTRDPGSDSWDLVPLSNSYAGADGLIHVEALLSDGFDPNAAPLLRTPAKGRLVSRVAWTVKLTDSPCLENENVP